MTFKYYSTLFALLLTASITAQKLSRTEKKIVSTIEKNNSDAIGFLERVVNINSGTLNAEGVKKVGMVFKDAFDNIGFETKWIEMPAEMNRSGHLFAETSGSKGKKLLLIGHLDTVFEEDSPFQTFEMVNDSIAHAPGGNDMKGGDVIVLYALKALSDNGLLDDAQIIVAFTGDEESTGKPLSISRKDLIDAAKRSDVALGFETSTGFNYATVARRGSSGWAVEVEGKRAHSSGVFSENTGAGAIFEMSRILHQFYTDVKGEDLLTFNPGVLLGGTFVNYDELTSKGDAFGKTNVVAQKAVVKGGLRFISEEQKERARAKMREIAANNLPQTSASISFTDSYPSMGPTEGNRALLSTLNEVSLDLKQGEVLAYDPGKRGAADISFVANYVDGLDGLGTMGSGAHTPQETVNLNTIEALTKRTAILIYRLINAK
ncbi:M20/M25/M40 family metallo-hydrolase [Flagellimonas halotolerans]|uniref:M20/M25/M40 family metallo-hydrolase n=1 Tax=Flagellimonas halotolerans TaxID=3112164 RepID=A0ABU6IQ15_9FLAO|nr:MULTISPECIES: M20/M25/M40 family metallo-hydrolase [unclassified Allomuricauda]MEC3965330.1 M20/M25/M40 family metallo-hydrolase [Muricauda sp. SYSU M86414]MEC4265196.1 M20/M25/M40 family metallo-hydrolase [Muricauda sp. SYSU M84420]